MPGKIHTKKFDDCVSKVKTGNAYAICMNALGYKKSVTKRHRRK